MREDIPAVDLSLGEDAVASTIRRACTTHGFFYVVNHGVSDEEVGAMIAKMCTDCCDSAGTRAYDKFQLSTNGIRP